MSRGAWKRALAERVRDVALSIDTTATEDYRWVEKAKMTLDEAAEVIEGSEKAYSAEADK